MKEDDWIKTYLPTVTTRLRQELHRHDPVPEEYGETAMSAAWYHISRHAKRLNAKPGQVFVGDPVMNVPEPCKVPAGSCKALALARSLLACVEGERGMAARAVVKYMDGARSVLPRLLKIRQELVPLTKALEDAVRPYAKALRPSGRKLLLAAFLTLDALEEDSKTMELWVERGAKEFLTGDPPYLPGVKHCLDRLDRITEPLLGCYFDREIAGLVADGAEPGAGDALAEARVSNRRYKLTGTRKGGRPGRPGRPRKARRET